MALPGVACAADSGPIPDKIDFNRDVRPFLSETCFKCHGFDPVARKAKVDQIISMDALSVMLMVNRKAK